MCNMDTDISNMVDEISDRVLEKLVPILRAIGKDSGSGVLIGRVHIANYFSRYRPNGRPYSPDTISRWYKYKGLPLGKNPTGEWWISTSMIDKWMYERAMVTRNANKLKYGRPHAGGGNGMQGNLPPERLSISQRDACWHKRAVDQVASNIDAGGYIDDVRKEEG